MLAFMRITKALSDENRLRALMALDGRELCVCQIIELLALAPSTVSKHLSILRNAELIVGRKDGRWMYYRLPGEEAPLQVRKALDWIRESVGRTDRIRQDVRRLHEILSVDPEELCKRYGGNQSSSRSGGTCKD